MILFKLRDKIHTSCKKSKDTTIPDKEYRDGLYKITFHAVKRMKERGINKGEVHVNLHTTPLKKTKTKKDQFNRKSYERYNKNMTNVRVNPVKLTVPTMNRFSWKSYNKKFNRGERN